jgi:hypothetical protein
VPLERWDQILERIIVRKIFSGGKEEDSCFRHFGESRINILELFPHPPPPPGGFIVD